MGSFVTNVLKKKVKQIQDGYVKLKDNKTSKKQLRKEECDKSGLYKAEPSEELYENLLISGDRRHCNDSAATSTSSKTSELSLPIPCSSKNSSNDSHEHLLKSFGESLDSDSPSSSLDSGISRTPPGFKKLKKLQFSPNSDEIHVFERNTLERRSYKEPEECARAQLCKTKVFEVPTADKVKIIKKDWNARETSSKFDATNSSNVVSQSPVIAFNRLRIKQSIVSPKTYHKSSKKNIKKSHSNNFLGNFAQRTSEDIPSQNSLETWHPESSLPSESLTSFNKCKNSYDKDLLTPLLRSPPEKPPRSAKDLRRIPLKDELSNKKSIVDDTEWTFVNNDLRDSLVDENGYSIPFDVNKEHFPEMSSTLIKEVAKNTAQTTPISSKDEVKMLSSAIQDITKIKPDHIYAQVLPRTSRNMEQCISPTKIKFPDSLQQGDPESPKNCENDFSCSQMSSIPDVKSTTVNDILSKENKDSLNMIHKTKWSLKMDDISPEHACHSTNKKPEELCLEQKFVVNMFQSRPSKRWEKHIRDMDKPKNPEEDEFDRNRWKRLSLDSKKQKTKSHEANVQIISDNFADVEREIEQLERESKSLEIVSKKIKRELKRMEQEDNDAYSKKLEKEKLQIENQLNKLNNNVDETSMKLANESKRIATELEEIKSRSTEDYNQYKKLKTSRDIQCTRMAQISRVLEEIKNRRGKKDWLEVLVAERTLLETSENVKLLTQQIRDNTYTVIPEPQLHKGTIHLSDIKFPFSKQFRGNTKREKHYTDFFVMTLSYGTQMFVSEFITGESDPLIFSRNHTFKNVTPDFEIKVQLFCLRLRTSDEYFWEKFTCCNLCPTSQIIYEDLLTHQFQEKTVYKTSFKLCAETTLTRTNIDEVSARLNTKPQVFCKLDTRIEFSLKCEDIDIVANLSGFLDVGTLCGETYFWERKWCVLDGPNLKLYNYPLEEDFGKPFEQINLEYCFGPIVTKVGNCPKRRCFQLKTGRPNDIMTQNTDDSKIDTLKTKPNFTLRKFYFAASNMERYLQWTVEVEKILTSLSDFKKLAFGEEYAEYLGQ